MALGTNNVINTPIRHVHKNELTSKKQPDVAEKR